MFTFSVKVPQNHVTVVLVSFSVVSFIASVVISEMRLNEMTAVI